jgi:hypothetical protein
MKCRVIWIPFLLLLLLGSPTAYAGNGGASFNPTITSISPASVQVAQPSDPPRVLRVNGTNFTDPTYIVWDTGSGTELLTTTHDSDTQLTVEVPATYFVDGATVTLTAVDADFNFSDPVTFTIFNTPPVLVSLAPAAVTAGGLSFTLQVNGSGFVPSSIVLWNGSQRPTTFVSSQEIDAVIFASDIASIGTAVITVVNPAPSGGTSVGFTFTIGNLPFMITSLSPSYAIVGSSAFTLTVNGSNFENGAQVLWNGTSRTTTFVSSTQLTAFIPAGDVAALGWANVQVANPGDVVSGSASFQIKPVPNPGPIIVSISPSTLYVGGPGGGLDVEGSGFMDGSVLRVNGQTRVTIVVSATELIATILASDIASTGTAVITVVNPPPGGGTSNALTLNIIKAPTAVAVSDLVMNFTPYQVPIQLSATVSGLPANTGSVTFAIKDGSIQIGSALTSQTLANGVATASGLLPGGLIPKAYTIEATYSGTDLIAGSTGKGYLILLVNPSDTLTLTLPAAGTGSIISSGTGKLATGYALLSPDTTTNPVAIANFAYSPDPTGLVTEVGVPTAAPVTATRLFIDYSSSTDSGLALVNPSYNTGITIKAEFRDATGTSVGYTNIPLPSKGHASLFASQLIPNLPKPFLGTLTLSTNATVFGPALPFVAVNLGSSLNSHGETMYTSLPVRDLSHPGGGSSLVFPQIIDGGNIASQIYLTNPSASDQSVGTIAFLDDAGNPLSLDFGAASGPQSALQFTLPPNGMAKFSTRGSGSMHIGYAVVTVSSGPLPVGAALFLFSQDSGLVSQAAVPDAPLASSARLFVDLASAPLYRNTGIALVNPGPTTANLSLKLTGADGTLINSTLTLKPHAHLAQFITDIFPGKVPVSFRGVLDITSPVPVAILTLRMTVNQRGETIYSTLPVADLNNPPQGQLFLPQIANGGGYQTQIIAIDTSSKGGKVFINLFDDKGASIPANAFQ